MPVDPNDFTNAAIESGESVNVYNPIDALNTDYGSSTAEAAGAATAEYAIIQPESESRILRSEGKLTQGDLFAMFTNSSIVTDESEIRFDNKRYKVKNLIEVRPGGVINHYEANLELIEDTSDEL